jgi:hypothetical protein
VCKSLYCILTYIPLDILLGVELLNHMSVLLFVFWRASVLFSIVVALIYIPISSMKGFLFPTSSPTFVVVCLPDGSQSNRSEDWEMWIWFAFPLWRGVEHFFMWVFFGHLYFEKCLFSRLSISSLNYWFFGSLVFWAPCKLCY